MGSWNQTCAVTGNSIFSGEDVVGIWLLDGNPLPFYIRGKYNDYGCVEEPTGCLLEEALNFFKENLVELEQGENKYHDIPVNKNNFDFDLLMRADLEERLFLNLSPGWGSDPQPLKLEHIEIKAEVFNKLIKYEVDVSWRDYKFGVKYLQQAFQSYIDHCLQMRNETDDIEWRIQETDRYKLQYDIRMMFRRVSDKRLSPNTRWFPDYVSDVIFRWDEAEYISDVAFNKYTAMSEVLMACICLEHAGRTLTQPPSIGQEDNSDAVEWLASLTIETANNTRQYFDE